MTLTIFEGYDKTYIMVGSKDERFEKEYGTAYVIQVNNLYRELADIASWCNNELWEECLFEID